MIYAHRIMASQQNTVILDAYIDRAMTGTNDNRPAFQKMIRDSEKTALGLCHRVQIRQICKK